MIVDINIDKTFILTHSGALRGPPSSNVLNEKEKIIPKKSSASGRSVSNDKGLDNIYFVILDV